ncbi:RNA polymerase sigma factor [Clostridium cellulovorans]|uniref:RNA polymerase, sigma-24 subunit, ECF subfamily n=1 Tax=Clostridium cellulovorans (strain ATCC 35296 / DSM 3052 / OCM 3 / 743B) TaxID=573061 RepID=D9SV16_CLOC7|nr:sigma-70 family RNA polymerase sigma factor [Clostridium cellulovorans]ADL52991.1 RNA polymerase, sigma-24 subunit, ECF subfamily [Clostridium cellulovorans 743B]
MDKRGELRDKLLRFIKAKFWSRAGIAECAEDIVDEAFLALLENKDYSIDKENFGYLSVVCIRIAFKYFKKLDDNEKYKISLDACLDFISEEDFVEDIMRNEDTSEVLKSLEILKEIERIIISQRYYGNYTFAEIAEKNGIKLNTVLSHHRRALQKLRPTFAKFFDFSENQTTLKQERRTGHFTKFL